METGSGMMWMKSNRDNSISKPGLIEYYIELLDKEIISVDGPTYQRLKGLLEKETPKEKAKRLLNYKDILY